MPPKKRNLGSTNIRISTCHYCGYETQGEKDRNTIVLRLHVKTCKFIPEEERANVLKSVYKNSVVSTKATNEFGLSSIKTKTNISTSGEHGLIRTPEQQILSGSSNQRYQQIHQNVMSSYLEQGGLDWMPSGPMPKSDVIKMILDMQKNDPEMYKTMSSLATEMKSSGYVPAIPDSVSNMLSSKLSNTKISCIDQPGFIDSSTVMNRSDIFNESTDLLGNIDITDSNTSAESVQDSKKKRKKKKNKNKNKSEHVEQVEQVVKN